MPRDLPDEPLIVQLRDPELPIRSLLLQFEEAGVIERVCCKQRGAACAVRF